MTRDHDVLDEADFNWLREILEGEPTVCDLRAGGNNRVFLIRSGDQSLALKRYTNAQNDPRDRVGTEYSALRFLGQHLPDKVPAVHAFSTQPPRLLLDWIEGSALSAPWELADIEFAAEFLQAVAWSGQHARYADFSSASEACFSLDDFTGQFQQRRDALLKSRVPPDYWSQFDELLESLRVGCSRPGVDDLVSDVRCLVPADFSLHNVIRCHDERRVVVDFEYFGWDDPVKGVADFLLHPAMNLDPEQRAHFLRIALPLFQTIQPGFERRLHARLPWYALRWSLIVLNPLRHSDTDSAMVSERLERAFLFLKRARTLVSGTERAVDHAAE